jgi:hypothetical protein
MRKRSYFTFCVLVSGLIACTGVDNGGGNSSSNAKGQVPLVTPPPAPADSVDIVYYKKPFTDPERYTRFFSAARVSDSTFRAALDSLLVLPGVRQDSVRDCMSEGKILEPLKGDAFRIIYFARSGNTCNYLYQIRDGAFYYYELPVHIKGMLDVYEKKAKELPVNEGPSGEPVRK